MSRTEPFHIKLSFPGESLIGKWVSDGETGLPTSAGELIEMVANTLIYNDGGNYLIIIPNSYENPHKYFSSAFNSFKKGIRQIVTNQPSPQHKLNILDDFRSCIAFYESAINIDKGDYWQINFEGKITQLNTIYGYGESIAIYFLSRKNICLEVIMLIDGMKSDIRQMHPGAFLIVPKSETVDANAINPFLKLDILFQHIDQQFRVFKNEFHSDLADEKLTFIGNGEFVGEEIFFQEIAEGKFDVKFKIYYKEQTELLFVKAFNLIIENLHLHSYPTESFAYVAENILKYNNQLLLSKTISNDEYFTIAEKLNWLYSQLLAKFPSNNIIKEKCGFIHEISPINLNLKFQPSQIKIFIKSIFLNGMFDVRDSDMLIPYFTGQVVLRKLNWNLANNEYNYFFSTLSTKLNKTGTTEWLNIQAVFTHKSPCIKKSPLKNLTTAKKYNDLIHLLNS